MQGTKDLILTLWANNDGIVQWWIDASYAVHEDMKGHTRATLSLGKGVIYIGSWKHRLVACSSTESELIGVYDVLLQVLWTKQFLEEQGWLDSTTMVYQDNTSSILLEKNGRSSSTKQTKHMHIRYCYVMEQVQKKQFMSPIARQKKWSPISIQTPYRVDFSLRYANISWEMKNLLTRLFPGVC